MSKLAQDINSVGAELFEGRLSQDINSVDAELVQETTVLSLTAPANGQTGVALSMTFSWTDSESRGLYRLLYDTDSNFGSPTVVWTETTSHNATLTSGTYYWKVEAHNTVQQDVIPTGSIGDDSEAGDIASLELFYDNLGGASWTDNTGWASTGMSLDTAPFGITTSEVNGETRVTKIDLENNNLVGQIPEFPGLQECWYLRLKQQTGSQTDLNQRITGTIPDSIGNNTKITHLSLAGRRNGDFVTLDDFNKKRGTGINQFTGGIPNSLYNLALEYFELDGQFALEATLTSGVANWNIKRLFMGSAIFDGASKSAIIGDWPSESKNWVDCERLYIQDNLIDSFPLDMFEGWNTIASREIELGFEANGVLDVDGVGEINQAIPDLSALTDLSEFYGKRRRFTGEVPFYFFDFPSLNSIILGRNAFQGPIPFSLENKVGGISSNIDLRNDSPIISNPLSGDLFAGPVVNSNVIIYDVTDQVGLTSVLAEGMEDWLSLRYVWIRNTGGTELPSKPPGQWAPNLRQFDGRNAKLTGNITADYANMGSIEKYGGILDTGTIQGDGEDVDGFYVDVSEAYTADELVGFEIQHINPNSESSRPRVRTITKNTTSRIYYEGVDINGTLLPLEGIDVGETYNILRHGKEGDPRPFDSGYYLNGNNLTGLLPSGGAPTQMEGGTFDISDNNYTMANLAPNIQEYIDTASNLGYTFVYSPQKKFGVEEVEELPSGSDFTIDYSSFDYTGNVYTWYKDDVVISGETDSSLALTNITTSNTYRVEVTNPAVPDFTNVSADTIIEII